MAFPSFEGVLHLYYSSLWDHSVYGHLENIGKRDRLFNSISVIKLKLSKPTSLFFFNFLNVYSYLRDRERQSVSRGGAEREGDTESEAGSSL